MRWRGPFEAPADDVLHDSSEVFSDLFGGNSKRLYALVANPPVAPIIALRIVTEIMCQSINLDGNGGRFAEEIENERAVRMLTSKLQSLRAHSKHSPEADFRRTHASAKLARLMDSH